MTPTERLILENQRYMMQLEASRLIKGSEPQRDLLTQIGKVMKALSPQSEELGYEESIEEKTTLGEELKKKGLCSPKISSQLKEIEGSQNCSKTSSEVGK